MNRRTFVAGAVTLLATPLAAEAQSAGKLWRVGWLAAPSEAAGAFELEALREGLRALNYADGRNITIEAKWGDGDLARLPALGRVLVELKVDIIFTAGTPATLAAKAATSTIPIVFGRVAFPEKTGREASRAGHRATGVGGSLATGSAASQGAGQGARRDSCPNACGGTY